MKDERVLSQIRKNKEKTIAEMQKLIQQASVSTENLGITECAELIRDYFASSAVRRLPLLPQMETRSFSLHTTPTPRRP